MRMILDHLAVAADTLEAGRAHVEAMLGVTLQTGGKHAHFGTHNLLLGLEDGLYLEVIAIDPDAPEPAGARWFDLDRFSGPARLRTWICRVDDLPATVNAHPGAGDPVALSRGDLRWRMAVPGNGILPYDNLFPALIEWQGQAHPAQRLAASGCRLRRLTLRHPEAARLQAALQADLADDRIAFETGAAGMSADFDTPRGPRVLT